MRARTDGLAGIVQVGGDFVAAQLELVLQPRQQPGGGLHLGFGRVLHLKITQQHEQRVALRLVFGIGVTRYLPGACGVDGTVRGNDVVVRDIAPALDAARPVLQTHQVGGY